jgi:hypothetical protein
MFKKKKKKKSPSPPIKSARNDIWYCTYKYEFLIRKHVCRFSLIMLSVYSPNAAKVLIVVIASDKFMFPPNISVQMFDAPPAGLTPVKNKPNWKFG